MADQKVRFWCVDEQEETDHSVRVNDNSDRQLNCLTEGCTHGHKLPDREAANMKQASAAYRSANLYET